MRKVYINNHYCPQAVADDLFGFWFEHPMFTTINTRILCWNNIVYDLIYVNAHTQEYYFEIYEYNKYN